jgi:mercuric ion transport protein
MHPPVMTIKDDHRVAESPRGQSFSPQAAFWPPPGAASCCVVPLLLFMLGVRGAWIGNLNSYCASPSSNRVAKIGLWTATILIIAAIGFPRTAVLFL